MSGDYRGNTSSIWRWIGGAPGHTEKPSPRALADRERRMAMGEQRDLTGRMLGDPPPGRSALDQKLAAEERARLARLLAAEQSTEEGTT